MLHIYVINTITIVIILQEKQGYWQHMLEDNAIVAEQ